MKPDPPQSKAVDAYIEKAAPFAQPILDYIREAVHEAVPEATEAMKWSRPFFMYGGIILGNMAAFKNYCSLGLWGAETITMLRNEGLLAGGAMGSFGRIKSIDDLPPRKELVRLIRKTAALIYSGERTRSLPSRQRVAKAEVAVPDALANALEANPAAHERFRALSPSCRREYCEWIGEAKRPETRSSRATTAIEWIAEGKSRNWKYEAKR